MSLQTIKTAIAAKIAAATSSTSSDELGLLKVIGKKLGLNTSNLVTLANTISDSANASTDTADLALWNQTINNYMGNSIEGECRYFSLGLPVDFLDSNGARWLRSGFIESDSSKFDSNLWQYPFANVITKDDVTQNSAYKTSTRSYKLPNGKFVSVLFANRNSVQTFDHPYDTSYTTVKSVGESVAYCDYHPTKDILLVLTNSGALHIGKNNCTEWTQVSNTVVGVSSSSVHWINNDIFVCGNGTIKRSTNDGVTWVDYAVPSASFKYVGLAYVASSNLLYVFARTGSTQYSSYSSTEGYSLYSCLLGDTTWNLRGTGNNIASGICLFETYIDGYPFWIFHYNDGNGAQTKWICTINPNTGNPVTVATYSTQNSNSLICHFIESNGKKLLYINEVTYNYSTFSEIKYNSINFEWTLSNIGSANKLLNNPGNYGITGMLTHGTVIDNVFYCPTNYNNTKNVTFIGGAGLSKATALNSSSLYARIS